MKGRYISDNYIIAHEILQSFKKKRKQEDIGRKLDMSKAYDRVEWDFIEAILRNMGFHEMLIRLIMECITSVSYSVLLNGSPFGSFVPSRG